MENIFFLIIRLNLGCNHDMMCKKEAAYEKDCKRV